MAEPLRSLPFTYDDYLLLPEDSPRCELIEGKLRRTPASTVTHQTLLGRLFATIFNFLGTSPIGTVLFAPTDVVLSETTSFSPTSCLSPGSIGIESPRMAFTVLPTW